MTHKPIIAVIGAGPAGLFGTQRLVEQGAEVALLNRDIRPGGLAEYGIYYDKYKIKARLRKQFHKILAHPDVHYYGNVTVGEDGIVTLDALRGFGFRAMMVAVGSQGAKWLGLPGEELRGVYHAKDVVYYYNDLPPFNEQTFEIGKRVALIGVGNVMADIAHWLVRDVKVDEVIAVARRGPAEVKFDRRELEYIARNLDVEALEAEIARVADRMRAVGQDPEKAKAFILSALTDKAPPRVSDTRVRFRFLSSPTRILGDESGRVAGLEVEDTELYLRDDGTTRPRRLGTRHILDVDTVILCIGNKVSETFGLPVAWNEFVKCEQPRFPVNGISFEVCDPESGEPIADVFVAGWARKASFGQVGFARKDARLCAEAVMRYVQSLPPVEVPPAEVLARLEGHLARSGTPVVTKEAWFRLEATEEAIARERGLPAFKFKSNAEMLAHIR